MTINVAWTAKLYTGILALVFTACAAENPEESRRSEAGAGELNSEVSRENTPGINPGQHATGHGYVSTDSSGTKGKPASGGGDGTSGPGNPESESDEQFIFEEANVPVSVGGAFLVQCEIDPRVVTNADKVGIGCDLTGEGSASKKTTIVLRTKDGNTRMVVAERPVHDPGSDWDWELRGVSKEELDGAAIGTVEDLTTNSIQSVIDPALVLQENLKGKAKRFAATREYRQEIYDQVAANNAAVEVALEVKEDQIALYKERIDNYDLAIEASKKDPDGTEKDVKRLTSRKAEYEALLADVEEGYFEDKKIQRANKRTLDEAQRLLNMATKAAEEAEAEYQASL